MQAPWLDRVRRAADRYMGAAAYPWVESLPALVVECAREWSLVLGVPFGYEGLNVVARGTRSSGESVVLKVCYPGEEFVTETAALALFDGEVTCRLLEV